MFRRRFKSSYNNVGDGVYAVNKKLRLIPVSEADNTCIAVALVYDSHRIMIEKNEDSNQSYKDASAGYNRSYLFYWGGYGTDQTGITNYKYLDESNTSGYLKPDQGSYKGTPYISENIFSWTSGVLSDWDGKTNSEVLKEVTEGGEGYGGYVTIGRVLNAFLASPDAKGFDDWYIPSCPQLSLIWMNLNSVNNALSAIGGKQFDISNTYWSSSERSTNYGWKLNFSSGLVVGVKKTYSYRVRFIRDIK